MVRTSGGQVALELGLVLAAAFAILLSFGQLAGFGLTATKVSHAAQEAAYVAASTDDSLRADDTACWAVNGGLQDPGAFRDAEICRTVVANLGNLDASHVSISVTPDGSADRAHHSVQVTVTYQEPITSPLLRWLLGDTFTTRAQASSWSN